MTASINASTTAGVVVTSDTSGSLALQTAGTTAMTISSGQVATFANQLTAVSMPTGSIIQVVQTVMTNTFSSSATTTQTDITNFNASITPQFTSSKILVIVDLKVATDNAANNLKLVLVRNSTNIYLSANSASYPQGYSQVEGTAFGSAAQYVILPQPAIYIDSPATTSSTTYKVQFYMGTTGTAMNMYVNRDGNNTSGSPAGQLECASTITLMEIR